MRILVLTDNEFLYEKFKVIIESRKFSMHKFDFAYSYNNIGFCQKYKDDNAFRCIDVNKESDRIIKTYDLIISLHCKQIFNSSIIQNRRCINIHPGYNPFNRGYYSQVFSIINKKPIGVTIHEMNERIDHGSIILQEKVEINSWDTSKDIYSRLLQKELFLIDKYLLDIIEKRYSVTVMGAEGNINYIEDFKALCRLDLDEKLTMGEAIDRLRALTFEGYKNAYFIDEKGYKICVELKLQKI